MESQWSDADAQRMIALYGDKDGEDVALRVYTSRLIGSDPSLVLHGGGNTSVKTWKFDDTGKQIEVLCVKGSGWDLGNIEPAGLPAVKLSSLLDLRKRESLSDEQMVNAQRTRLLDASAPNPSVETLLHAFLPHRFIDHSHADAVLAMVDQPAAEALCRETFGQRLAIVPYIMPGFALAKLAAQVYEDNPSVEGLLLLQHGLFTFGDSARESYERHVDVVRIASEFASKRRYWSTKPSLPPLAPLSYGQLAPMLRGLLGEGERRYILHRRSTPEIQRFVNDPHLADLSQVGVATPDHVIRTKPLPLILRLPSELQGPDLRMFVQERLAEFREGYQAYVKQQSEDKQIVVKPLDSDPRVILVPGLGMITVGATEKAAKIVADIYEHTIDVIRSASAVGTYQALPDGDIFDMEYWSLEQAKLGKQAPKPLQGRVVYVTGAASGIGRAVAERFHAAGATLYLVDREVEPLGKLARELGASYLAVDVTNEAAVRGTIDQCMEIYGGIDGVVSNAGTAPQGAMDEISTERLKQSFEVNLFAHHWVASSAMGIMKAQDRGGFLLFNASKAAFNPGPGFGPYAVPKAALVALMKQYALEGGAHGIRANAVNADRIRTGLLDESDVAARAAARGLSADDYYRSNLLGREVTADDVAQAFVNLALAQSTTATVLTVDGGNISASPR